MSVEKSTIYCGGMKEDKRQAIHDQFHLEVGMLPVRYLGLPLLTKRMGKSDYQPLIEKIKKRISLWTNRFLSMAGRLQLIKSVLMSIANFWMSSFCLPGACLKEINSICSAFLWSGPELNTKRAKIAWDVVTLKTDEGGLGLRPLKEVNVTCCLKLIWRATSSHSLWARWIKEYLLKGESFWAVREKSTLGSWVWKKLLKYRDKAKDFHRIDVRNGRGTSFWFDVWSDLGRLYELVGARGCIDMGISLSATVESAMLRRPRRHRYDLYTMIEEALNKQRSKMSVSEDVVMWKHNTDIFKAKFDTRRTWSLLRTAKPQVNWHKNVWFSFSTPKYSFMSWLAMHNRISTGDRMLIWGNVTNPGCILCQHQLETREHLFFDCRYSKEIWLNLTCKLFPSRSSSRWQDVTALLSDPSLPKLELYLLRYSFQVTLYSVWRERNNRRHGAPPTLPSAMIRVIDRQIRNQCLLLISK